MATQNGLPAGELPYLTGTANSTMKATFTYAKYSILLLILCFNGGTWAQKPVRMSPASAEEIEKALTALKADFDNPKAHRTYIYAMGLNNPQLVAQYERWMEEYPKDVNIPLAIGTAYYRAEMPQAEPFLLKVAAMEPQNGEIWTMLSINALMKGRNDLSVEYRKKATAADPSNARYAANYLLSFQDNDPDDYKQKVFDFIKRFPQSEPGAQALYWLAQRTVDVKEKVSYLEDLRRLYPPQKFTWSASGMIGLADAYLSTDPQKALTLINEMGEGKDWEIRKQVAESLIRVNKMAQDQNYKEALIELNKVELPRFNYIADFIALRKSSLMEKTGNVQAAYDSLAVKFAELPTDELYSAVELYGRKIGKTKEEVDKDIETIRVNKAIPAYSFELGLYTSNDKLSLNELKGKVVLLTFWFPGCGPCRAEFPHFQAVIDRFKDESVAYVAINVFPEQDPFVIPFIENNNYSFIPLRGTLEFAGKHYGVQGMPRNFLIDKDGKIIFKDFRIDNRNHRTLELMISSLLQKGSPGN